MNFYKIPSAEKAAYTGKAKSGGVELDWKRTEPVDLFCPPDTCVLNTDVANDENIMEAFPALTSFYSDKYNGLIFKRYSEDGTEILPYYVASDGNNGNPGTEASPFATLAYAITQASDGDCIYMMPGTHTISSTVSIPKGVKLIGAGDTSIITSDSLASEWEPILSLVSGTHEDGNNMIGYLKFDGNNLAVAQCMQIEKRNNVVIHDCTIVDFNYTGIFWVGDGGYSGADPYTGAYPPDNYATGSRFYNNVITNCSYNLPFGWGRGCLYIGGHEGMEMYGNTITSEDRADGYNGYPIKAFANGGWMRGWKCYNNIIRVGQVVGGSWPFAIEGCFFIGCEIYNNTDVVGAIDVNFMEKDTYNYGLYIHGNTIGPKAIQSNASWTGIYLEFGVEDVIIENNWFRNLPNGINHTMRDPKPWVKRVKVRYNVFSNSGCTTNGQHSCIRFGETQNNFTIEDYEIYNNTFHADDTDPPFFCLHIRGFSTATNIKIRNNIIDQFSYYWFDSNRGDYFDGLYIENNLLYDNVNSNNPNYGGTPQNLTYSNNIVGNPNYVSPGTDYRLQTGSPGINTGLDLGLTEDYAGVAVDSTPNKGAYETVV